MLIKIFKPFNVCFKQVMLAYVLMSLFFLPKVSLAADYTWNGSAGDDWFDPANWSSLSFDYPGMLSGDVVTVPDTTIPPGSGKYPLLVSPLGNSLVSVTIQTNAAMTAGDDLTLDDFLIIQSGGNFTQNSGMISVGTGGIAINTGGTMTQNGSQIAFDQNSGSFLNNGLLELNGGKIGIIPTDPTAIFSMQNNGVLEVFGSLENKILVQPDLTNTGTIRLTMPSAITPRLTLNAPELSNQLLNQGVIEGIGIIDVLNATHTVVKNDGSIMPGGDGGFGVLSINGNFQQTVNGELTIDIISQTQIDQLEVTGNIDLDGEINITTGLTSLPDGIYPILTYTGTRTGTFSSEILPNFTGKTTSLEYITGVINLVVTTDTPQTITWTGGTDNSWAEASNWDSGVPQDHDHVIIPSGTPYSPILSTDTFILSSLNVSGNLTISSTAGLTVFDFSIHNGGIVTARNLLNLGGDGSTTPAGGLTPATRIEGRLYVLSNGNVHWYGGNIELLNNGLIKLLGNEFTIENTISSPNALVTGSGAIQVGDASSIPVFYSNHPLEIDSGVTFQMENGSLYGMENISVKGSFAWNGGSISGGVSSPLPTMTLGGSAVIGNGGDLSLEGRHLFIDNSASSQPVRFLKGSLTLNSMAGITIRSGSEVTVQNDLATEQMVFYQSLSGSVFTNNGTIKGSGKLAFLELDVEGTIFPPPDFVNTGVIEPGAVFGILGVATPFYDHGSASLLIDIKGKTAGLTYDRLAIAGEVMIGGTLDVALDLSGGFIPASGDQFTIMTYTSLHIAGTFGTTNLKINGVTQNFGDYFSIDYQSTAIVLTYIFTEPPVDLCPGDPEKTVPGLCGCGTPDTDTDGDTIPDCLDECPEDSLKEVPGSCGCGIPDTDTDVDTIPDCLDECKDDPLKTEPGACGCGIPDIDINGDGVPDCLDQCPDDPDKTIPGLCGCGIPDTDTDGDSIPDCRDKCPDDPDKTIPGVCGCGTPDTDTDGDTIPDCQDKCPDDPLKTEAGVCGCGIPDIDTNGDGIPDCGDQCPDDPDKIIPGLCGCGTPDTDTDGDTTPDCLDGCKNDPLKTEAGLCGCGVPDTDTDGDNVPDCRDECPNDPLKTEAGLCGCGVADTDRDSDGVADCKDLCPDDPNRTVPGKCGCGIEDDQCPDIGSVDGSVVLTQPIVISPLSGRTEKTDLVLEGEFFASANINTGIETFWQLRRTDLRCRKELDVSETTYGGRVKKTVAGLLKAGLRYAWRLGVENPVTGEMLWSDESTFIVGQLGVYESPPVLPGVLVADYRLISFPLWFENTSIQTLFGSAVGSYDTRYFKIGAYDPILGRYVEYPDGFDIEAGRAYWVLAREGLDLSLQGVFMNNEEDIRVHLYKGEGGEGWNLIAPPNNRDYYWGDLLVFPYTNVFTPEPGFENPVSLSDLYLQYQSTGKENEYIDLRLWIWKDGDYTEYFPGDDNAVLRHDAGGWVRAKQSNICLVFPNSAPHPPALEEEPVLTASPNMKQLIRGGKNISKFLAPQSAVAASDDSPPMPMDGSAVSSTGAGTPERVDSGGGGCFISVTTP